MLLILENHSSSEVIGSPVMPYFNSLVAQFGLAQNYFANTHPSIGNYFMLTTGNIETNDDAFTGTISSDNVPLALSAAGKTWKAYMESLPSAGYTGGDTAAAAEQHGMQLVVVKRPEASKGFVLLPRRWVVERSFAWASRFRRLARDYERLPTTLIGLHFAAFVCLLLPRLLSLIGGS